MKKKNGMLKAIRIMMQQIKNMHQEKIRMDDAFRNVMTFFTLSEILRILGVPITLMLHQMKTI